MLMNVFPPDMVTPTEQIQIKQMAQFIILFYMPYFLQASLPTSEPVFDITLWVHMKIYQQFDITLWEHMKIYQRFDITLWEHMKIYQRFDITLWEHMKIYQRFDITLWEHMKIYQRFDITLWEHMKIYQRFDITLWEHMKIYQQFDQEVTEEVMNFILRHHWYLTQECIILALFNGTLQDDIKAEMSLTLQRSQLPAQFRPRKTSFPVQTFTTR